MMDKDQVRKTIAAYKALFESQEGQLVLDDLSKQCYEKAVTFVDQNPTGSAFNEGKRFVLLHVRSMMSTKLK